MSLLMTAGIFTLCILLIESACWRLFRRKMQSLNFPIGSDLSVSHTANQDRLRIFAIAHTIGLIAFVWLFSAALWW